MATVLVVDDDRTIRYLIEATFRDTDHDVIQAGDVASALDLIRDKAPDTVLLDIELPGTSGLEAFHQINALDRKLPVIYITADGTSTTAIEAMKLGAFDYVLKPLDVAQVSELVERAIEIRRMMHVPVGMSNAVSPKDRGDQIIGRSPKMQDVFKAIGRAAPQDVTVLIRGESGTGKELVARALYHHSDRRDKPFLAVNCAAIPEQLLESDLFGHEKGAFTGADKQRIGKFEQCDGGTIFLDEIGDMPAFLQSKVLRLLQQQEFQRVGGNETIKVDVRIIAATNRDLEQMVAEGDYREDLLYRLNGYCISLPPLRDRGDDLVMLVEHFLARIGKELERKVEGIAPAALDVLMAYRWPGNIRELEGVIRQTLLQMSGTVIAPDFLPKSLRSDIDSASPPSRGDPNAEPALTSNLATFIDQRLAAHSANIYAETLEMMERYLLSQVLTVAEGNQSEAARILGITRGSLRHKIRSLGIRIESKIDVT